MSPSHALELVLTPADDAQVRSRWGALEAAGVASLARHRGSTHRPHLTVASSPHAPGEQVLAAALELWAPLLPLPLEVSGLVLLGGRRLTIAELVAAPLSARRAQAVLAQQWEGADQRPWVPHVSLAARLTVDDAGAALSALADDRWASPAVEGGRTLTVRGLRWWDPQAQSVSAVVGAAA